MPDWKHVKISFPTIKLGQFIESVKRTVAETSGNDYHAVYGVTNTEGITVTGKKASKDISNYIAIDKGCFAYNPYRINVGSIGFNDKGIKGCVSPAYVVFKTRSGFSPEFLFLYLKSDFGNHLINWYGNRGGVRNALRYDDLCEIDVPRIDPKEQIPLLEKIQRTNTTVAGFNSGLNAQLSMLQQLRQAVLQEAIEGKLTAEWRKENLDLISGENCAAKLFEKIRSEKDRLVKEGKIRKEKPLPPVTDDEEPFVLPDGWVWCRLGEVSQIFAGFSFNSYDFKIGDGAKCIKITNAGVKEIVETNDCLPKSFIEKYPEFIVKEGDLIIALTRPYIASGLKVSKCPKSYNNALLNQRVAAIRKLPSMYFEFIYIFMISDFVLNGYKEKFEKANLQPNLRMGDLTELETPLPPLAEQQVIVERVGKLFAVIDELGRQVAERKGQSELLMQSVLREAFEHSHM